MIIESGTIIFIGLLLLFLKLKRPYRRWLLKHSLALDLLVAGIVYALHWGTFSGVMAAATAGLLTSAFTAGAQRWEDSEGNLADFITGGKVDASLETA